MKREMTYLDAACEILRQEGKPLHLKVIIERAKAQKLIKTNNPTAHSSLGTGIDNEIKKRVEQARFVKDGVAKATYGLRDYTVPPHNSPAGGHAPKHKKGPDYVGPGGELLVQSELLFREYEASKPVPDIGIHIVARKGGKTFYIQVKTRKGDPYSYDVKKRSFERTPKQDTYYVFVMRSPSVGSADFIVLPRVEMMAMIKKGDIKLTKNKQSYQVIFNLKAGDVKCKGRSMAQYKNNWTIV